MALRSPQIQVVAIATVAGNVDVHQATRNALYTAELCDSNVPVFSGAERPLNRPHISASWFHGHDGLGDHGYPTPRRAPEKQNATDAIIDTVESHSGLIMVTLGPLTNVALALQKKPGIAARVSRCITTKYQGTITLAGVRGVAVADVIRKFNADSQLDDEVSALFLNTPSRVLV